MFDALKETIIGPNPCPWPWPKKPLDTKDILIMALLYIMILILTKGVAAGTAFAMASKNTVSQKMCCGWQRRINHGRNSIDSAGGTGVKSNRRKGVR